MNFLSGKQFFDFVFRNRINRLYLWSSLALCILSFFIFKLFYPYPNLVMDSYIYIKGAVQDLGANSFPIGYSKFLQVFDWISHSATLFVWLQFLFLESACLFLFFTLLYLFRPGKAATVVLMVFLFFNPIFLFMSNFVMSDALFTALSIFWVVSLIWIIFRPHPFLLLLQAGLLFLAFTIRYNALYYPFVATIVLLASRFGLWYKLVGIGLQFLLIGIFVLHTRGEMQKLTGVNQFSPFGGWQLANNALYMYGHIYPQAQEPAPAEYSRLDSTVKGYFFRTHRVESLLDYNAEGPGFFYMVSGKSPLIKYMHTVYGPDTAFQDYRKWGPVGGTYGGYGAWMIRQHPFQYARYFVWPNTIRYFNPPPEIFAMYSPYFLRSDELGGMARQLFDLKTLTVGIGLINFRTALLSEYPLLFLLINLAFVLSIIGFCGLKGRAKQMTAVVFLGALLWLANLAFSVTASCVVLRYQVFIMVIAFAFSAVMIDFIYRYKGPEIGEK